MTITETLEDEQTKPSGDDATENESTETETQDQVDQQTDVSDYLESDNTSTDWKKRYGDSSREAQKIKQELDTKETELSELVSLINNDPVMAERARKIANGEDVSTNTNQDTVLQKVAGLEATIANLTKGQNEEIIKKFEAGKNITTDIRNQLKPEVTKLTNAGYPLSEALEIAWIRKNGGNIQDAARKEGETEALARLKTNEDGTYTTSNSNKQTKESLGMTQEEIDKARKIGVDVDNPEKLQKYATKLKEVRLMNK